MFDKFGNLRDDVVDDDSLLTSPVDSEEPVMGATQVWLIRLCTIYWKMIWKVLLSLSLFLSLSIYFLEFVWKFCKTN